MVSGRVTEEYKGRDSVEVVLQVLEFTKHRNVNISRIKTLKFHAECKFYAASCFILIFKLLLPA